MAADRHRAFCVGAPRSLSVLRGKSDPLDTYRVCRTLRYYYKASRSSLSTGPHARNPGPRAQPPWAPRHCAFSNWDFSAPRAPNTVTDSDTVIAFCPLLLFRWYGEPAAPQARQLDLNRASASQIHAAITELTPERCQRLVRERQRAPFRDLADLQQRLQLPASLVETLIGRVRFGQGPAGPVLPRPS